MGGIWRETRNPTVEEVSPIGGETQKLGIGEFAEYTYLEILTYKPKYAALLIEEGNRGHIDMEKFLAWVMRKDVGIAAGDEGGTVERRDHAKNIPTVGEEFGFLIIPRGIKKHTISKKVIHE